MKQNIEADSNNSSAYTTRGEYCLNNVQFDEAIKNFTEAILLDPNNSRAYAKRGEAYRHQGRYDMAIKDYRQAIKLEPDDFSFYADRGRVYQDQRRYDKAVKDFTKALSLNPYHFFTLYWRGMAYAAQGQYDKAIKDYTESARHVTDDNPFILGILLNRGTAYMRKGLYDAAIRDYTREMSLNSRGFGIVLDTSYLGRAAAYLRKGCYDEALMDFCRVLCSPFQAALSGFFHLERGNESPNKSDYDEVLKKLQETAKQGDEGASVFAKMGWTADEISDVLKISPEALGVIVELIPSNWTKLTVKNFFFTLALPARVTML